MSKQLPAKRLTLLGRIIKAFYRKEDKPERPAHGANWEKPQGQNNPFPARVSMAAFASHGYVFAAVSRASQDLAALPIKLIQGKGKNAKIIEEHPGAETTRAQTTILSLPHFKRSGIQPQVRFFCYDATGKLF